MREWILSRTGQSLVLGALALVVILTAGGILVVPALVGSRSDIASVDEPLDVATATPTITETPSPAATPTPAPETTAAAAPDAPAPAAGQPAAPQESHELPGIIAMNPGPYIDCGENPTGQTNYLSFSWGARDGNTVDLYYAYTDGDYQATSGFVLFGSGLATNGTVQIPRPCPVGPGSVPAITVKLVANNPYGSATAYYWGI